MIYCGDDVCLYVMVGVVMVIVTMVVMVVVMVVVNDNIGLHVVTTHCGDYIMW